MMKIRPSSRIWTISCRNCSKNRMRLLVSVYLGIRQQRWVYYLFGILKILYWRGQNDLTPLFALAPSVLKSITIFFGKKCTGILFNFFSSVILKPKCKYSPPAIRWIKVVATIVGVCNILLVSFGRKFKLIGNSLIAFIFILIRSKPEGISLTSSSEVLPLSTYSPSSCCTGGTWNLSSTLLPSLELRISWSTAANCGSSKFLDSLSVGLFQLFKMYIGQQKKI